VTTSKKRISAMQALIAGTPIGITSVAKILDEFTEVYKVEKLNPLKRRRLLQVVHLSRALDSFLREFTATFGVREQAHSLGQYLSKLEKHGSSKIGRLPAGMQKQLQTRIVDKRNRLCTKLANFQQPRRRYVCSLRTWKSVLMKLHDCRDIYDAAINS
jgi:hypothetical protein